jgi:tetratricopeptide (TPR) repeat protein
MHATTTRLLALILAGVALPAVSIAQTDPSPPADFTRMTDAELGAAYAAAVKRQENDFCGFNMPLFAQMEARGTFNPKIKYLRAFAEMQCALTERRWTDAYQKLKYVESSHLMDLGDIFFVDIARLADDRAAASSRLLAYLETDAVKEPKKTLRDTIGELARTYTVAKDHAGLLGLYRELQQPARLAKLDDDTRISLQSRLFAAEVEAGNLDRAAKLVGKVKSADTVLPALGDRRFETLWPQLEAAAGPHMRTLLDAELARATDAHEADPDDLDAFQRLATAYLRSGRFEDVIKLVDERRPVDFANLTEDMGWALNAQIYALDGLGRHAEAGEIFNRIAALPYDPAKNGWIVSFVINRASRLIGFGDYEKGLAAAMLAGRVAEESGSAYARMLVRNEKVCALTALGRGDEAKPILAEVEDHLDDSVTVAAATFLCAGAEDRAAEVVRDALNDPYDAMAMATALQRPEFDFYYTRSVLPTLAERIKPRPDVAPVFEKVARDIPIAFVTPFGKRREEQAAADATS